MKRYLSLAAIFMLLISFAGCAKSPTAEGEPEIQLPEESTAPILTVGETVTIDGVCEFQVNQVEITDNPENYYEARDGETYVELGITYQHLADSTISADNIMKGKLIYSGLYEYGFDDIVKEEEGLTSWDLAYRVKIGQSDTRQVYYFFAVPKELQDSGRKVELNINIRGNDYRVIVRDGDKGVVPGREDSRASGKDSRDIADGEIVVTEDAEFCVEYSEFTKDVLPQNSGLGYNHYPAEDGKILLDFCIAYTNRRSQKTTASKLVSAKLKQAEAHVYTAEDNNRSMFDSPSLVNILPLCTKYVHWIFQIPEEMATNDEELTISFKVDGKNYTYSVK